MSAHSPTPPAELLDDSNAALTLDALARACRMDADWVAARLQEGLLQAGTEGEGDRSAWRFSGATVVRARRIARSQDIVTYIVDVLRAVIECNIGGQLAAANQRAAVEARATRDKNASVERTDAES